jgi:hypothetical protein
MASALGSGMLMVSTHVGMKLEDIAETMNAKEKEVNLYPFPKCNLLPYIGTQTLRRLN